MQKTLLMRHLFFALNLAAVLFASAKTVDKDIKIINPADGVVLAGTLTQPIDKNPRGVLILVTGSGCQDRDETIFGKKPFRTIADSLAAHGYASFRYDDRGAGESGGDFKTATADTYLSDLKCMLACSDSIFKDTRTGILGHSEGAWTAIQSVSNPSCDFIITLAGPAWKGDSLIMSQSRAIAVAQTGRWDKEKTQRKLLDICMMPVPENIIKTQLYMALSAEYGDAATMPAVQKQLSAAVDVMTAEHYRQLLNYDPAEDIKNVSKPWLAINGSVDIQVLPENLETIKQLNKTVDTVLLEGHNHLFQKGGTGSIQEYKNLDGDISAECMFHIIDWLDKLEK